MAEITKLEGDMFWDADDPEWSQSDPDDFFYEDKMDAGHVFQFQQASRLSDFYGFAIRGEDGDLAETRYFETKEEAEAALKAYKEKEGSDESTKRNVETAILSRYGIY